MASGSAADSGSRSLASPAADASTVTRGRPSVVVSPTRACTAVTVPGAPARTTCSIFIASRTSNCRPAATCSPTATSTVTTVPVMGAATVASPPPAFRGRLRQQLRDVFLHEGRVGGARREARMGEQRP